MSIEMCGMFFQYFLWGLEAQYIKIFVCNKDFNLVCNVLNTIGGELYIVFIMFFQCKLI